MVSESHFLTAVIVHFDHVFFWEFIAIYGSLFVSATKTGGKNTLLCQTNDSFVAMTQRDKQDLRTWQKKFKKVDMIKIDNHFTKKISFEYLV